MTAAAGDRTAFTVLLALHIVAALAGFGAVALAGVYGATARRLGSPSGPAAEEVVRFFSARSVAEWAIGAVPVFGVAATLVDPGSQGLDQVWVAVAAVLWLVAAAVVIGVARPARAELRRLLGLDADPPVPPADADAAQLATAGGRLAWASATCDVVFVLAVVDMIIQPH